jgi:hypothetical protein
MMVAIVKESSQKISAVAALFICEAWAVKQKHEKGQPIPQVPTITKGRHRPSIPTGVEVVQIIATDGMAIEARMLEIKRDWKNKIVDLVVDNPFSAA